MCLFIAQQCIKEVKFPFVRRQFTHGAAELLDKQTATALHLMSIYSVLNSISCFQFMGAACTVKAHAAG